MQQRTAPKMMIAFYYREHVFSGMTFITMDNTLYMRSSIMFYLNIAGNTYITFIFFGLWYINIRFMKWMHDVTM